MPPAHQTDANEIAPPNLERASNEVNCATDFIRDFKWLPTKYNIESQRFEFIDSEYEGFREEAKDRDQIFLLEQLYQYTSQMVELYKYLQESCGYKNVHIKPSNILQASRRASGMKVYHLDTSTVVKCAKDAEQMLGPSMLGSSSQQPDIHDLWDLACFIYFLCTRERLVPSDDDFDNKVMQSLINAWLKQYKRPDT